MASHLRLVVNKEIDFGYMDDKPKVKVFIIYNYHNERDLEYSFNNPGFSLDDTIKFESSKGKIKARGHEAIKITLKPNKNSISSYEGEIEIKIEWSQVKQEKEKENLFVRIIKRPMIKEVTGKLNLDTKSQSLSFIEFMLLDLIKDLLAATSFTKLLEERLDNQPLKLYEWTNNVPYKELESVRSNLFKNSVMKAEQIMQENNSSYKIQRGLNHGHTKMSNVGQTTVKNRNTERVYNNAQNKVEEDNDENEENKIEEKYKEDLIQKFGYENKEIEEKLLFINDFTRKYIYDVLEDTIFNIIAEAVDGETDLSEPTKIFFRVKK